MDPSTKLCMGCMNELGSDGRCHYCNYTDDIPHLQAYLAPRTVLDNRYIVGKMLSYNGEGASYICYDMVGKCKCVAREYMPDTLCERDSESQRLVVNPDCLAKYKTFMSEFADVNKVLSRMRNLQHIATAKDMFCENNTTYVILEYVEGVTLKKFLQSNTGFLTWEQVKKLFVPLFTTLSIIHNAGIIHRGISPENIIVTTDCELKLTGFCISSIRTSNTGLSPEFYSGYTAPEQYSSLEWQGTWTDVYALAAVLYRILTGCMPLDAYTRTKNDTMVEACRVNPRIPQHISRVLSRAMRVRGEERIQTVSELVTALFEQHTTHMEHPKGSTQTIPIQHVPRQRTQSRQMPQQTREEEKPKNKTSTIIGWTVLVIVLLLSVFLLYELFSGPSDGNNDSSEGKVISSDDADGVDSEVFVYSTTVATPKVTDAESQSEYGYGAIMPNVVGLEYNTVVKQLGEDFTIKAEYYYSDVDDKDVVKEQSIPEGTDFDPSLKNELVLKVCAGPENVPVPDFSGLSKKAYLELLDSYNIKYKVVTDFSSSVSAGYVMATSVNVGNTVNVKNGDVLTVTVSAGLVTTTTTTTKATVPKPDTNTGSSSETTPAPAVVPAE